MEVNKECRKLNFYFAASETKETASVENSRRGDFFIFSSFFKIDFGNKIF